MPVTFFEHRHIQLYFLFFSPILETEKPDTPHISMNKAHLLTLLTRVTRVLDLSPHLFNTFATFANAVPCCGGRTRTRSSSRNTSHATTVTATGHARPTFSSRRTSTHGTSRNGATTTSNSTGHATASRAGPTWPRNRASRPTCTSGGRTGGGNATTGRRTRESGSKTDSAVLGSTTGSQTRSTTCGTSG